MGDVAAEIFFLEFLLRRSKAMVNVNNHKLDPPFVFFIQAHRPPGLPLGVETALAEHDHVSGLARNEPGVHIVAGDERSILAVAGVVEFGIQLQVFSGKRGGGQDDQGEHDKDKLLHYGLPTESPDLTNSLCLSIRPSEDGRVTRDSLRICTVTEKPRVIGLVVFPSASLYFCCAKRAAGTNQRRPGIAYTPTGNGLVCVVVLRDAFPKRPCSNDINPVYQYPTTNNNRNGTVM